MDSELLVHIPDLRQFQSQKFMFQWVSRLSYQRGRELQEALVAKRQAGLQQDTIILCEHLPTLSVGPRNRESIQSDWWARQGIDIVYPDRGGATTLHNPGQLIIYPVIDLRARKLGVKRFVELGLEAVGAALKSSGIKCMVALDPAGVWCGPSSRHKICSVGIRMRRGVTSHGFSVNCCNDLEPFTHFSACGISDSIATSIVTQAGQEALSPCISALCSNLAQLFSE